MSISKFQGNQLLVDGRVFYVRGGEIQYFRLPADQWRDRLQKARDGGLNTVSSYMPWYFHEPREGTFDFGATTCPERDLRRFLDQAVALDFKVIARPGPFINSELRCGGIPEWLFRRYPQALSRNSTGQPAPGRPLPAEGEPLYRKYVRQWYRAVVPLLAEYDLHRGGPIILFQPDNEISAAWSFGLLNSLYDPTILGQTWPAWLERTYQSLDALSDRYGRALGRFAEVAPPRSFPQTSAERRLAMDWLNFKRWFFADWGATLAHWAVEDGIQVPFVFNEPVAGFYDHGDHAGFGSVLKEMGIVGTTACHTYSPLLMDLEGVTGVSMAVALTRSSPWGGPPLSVEVNTHWFMPRLNRLETNWDSLLRLGLARGLMGSIVYPFSAETVSLQDAIGGPEYFDPSCLDLAGNPTASYMHLRRFNRFVAAWELEIIKSNLSSSLSIGYSPGQRYLDFLGAPPLMEAFDHRAAVPGGEAFSAEPALNRSGGSPGHDWLDGYEGVSKQTVAAEAGLWKKTKEAALLLTRLNVSYNMLELTHPNRPPGKGWIIVACTGCLEKAAIDFLLAHLDQGGGVLFFPTVPVFDLDGRPDRRLADRLGVRLTRQVRPAGGDLIDYGTRLIDFGADDQTGVNGWIFIHDVSSANKVLACHKGQPVVAASVRDKGPAVVAGLDMAFTNLSSLRLWQGIFHDVLNAYPAVTVLGNYCHALLQQSSGGNLLTVLNLTGGSEPATIHVPEKNIAFTIDLRPHEARCLVLGVELAGKTRRLVYTTSEIIPLDADRCCMELWGGEGTFGEVAFAEPVRIVLDDQSVCTTPEADGYHHLRYRHQDKPRRLAVR